MAKNDMKTIGLGYRMPCRIAASATRGYAGEPMINNATYTSGVASANTPVVLTDDLPVIGTDRFVGILGEDMIPYLTGTIVAHKNSLDVPIPLVTRIRAKVTTSTTADTETEAIGLLYDIHAIDLISSTYTWKPAAADTAGFEARWYDFVKAQLDCIADPRVMSRIDIT